MAETEPGKGVDADGRAVVDPTKNVLGLVEANNVRLAELRAVDKERNDDLRKLTEAHSREVMELHVKYQERLTLGESERINAIRAVDVAAVATASERAAQQANVLANQVAASAETLRTLVASTSTALANQVQATNGQLVERIASLEKAQYQGAGRSEVANPAIDQLIREVRMLHEAQTQGKGKGEGISTAWGILMALVTLISMLIAIGSKFIR